MFAKKLSRREMAVWCAALALGCVLAGLSGFALDWGRAQLDTGAALCADTLRLHIKADSDSLQDQTAKLAVRDALLAYTDAQCRASTQPEALHWAAQNLPALELTARQTPETRRATRTVVHSYNERIARIKETHGLEDEPNVALRLQALRWERDYVGELIEREEVYPIVGYQYQSRLSHIEKLLKHNAGRWTAQNAYLRLRALLRSLFHGIVRGLPGVSMPERSEAMRDVQVKAAEHVMGKLQQAIADSDVPTEDASALLLEYQRTCMALRNANPSITAIARANDKVEDVRRLGLRLELEQIQTRYEEGELSRACAKRLRENVYLMQIDLEDNV